jgi:tetratricopeptide (TPR) repeat protein
MQRLLSARACTLLGLAVLVLPGPARAQEPTAPPEEAHPTAMSSWPLAAERFAEGTRLFKQWRFGDAERAFREALTHADHPIIYLYLSRALEKQGRLLDAHEALEQALRPHLEPLPPREVEVAGQLRSSLDSRLAQIEVHCDAPGAEIAFDGEHWFTAPGPQRRMTNAGQHVLVARKPGYFPVAEPVSLIPGNRTRVVLRMTADVVHLSRRWPSWQPKAVTTAGMVVSVAGGLFLLQARADYAAIQKDLDACPSYCDLRGLTGRYEDATWNERIGTGVLLTGSMLVAAGLAGMLLNLPQSRRAEPADGVESLDIAPMISRDTAGVSLWLRF